ncbi:MAG: hypothetical protein PHF11_06985, partial [Candidatus Omnitrophica bacterium]|nr:hypothetical protein [Candidatus Omnitrophota bacterium]
MNYIQIGLFLVYAASTFICGLGIYALIAGNKKDHINGSVLIGEIFLFGSIFIVGELLLLSFAGLFNGVFLWPAVCFNFLFLFSGRARRLFSGIKMRFDLPILLFGLLLAVFIFRNIYFNVDIDSLFHYLTTQRNWLSSGTSFFGGPASNSLTFVPQFDILPSALGLSIFPQETLFPQLVNLFWRLICLVLVFGYTSYRFNGFYGLSAAALVALNDHFFFSGENRWVLINGAVIAFLFAAAYNFWEGRHSAFRLMLAFIFIFQVIGNKLQAAYIFLFFIGIGLVVQQDLREKLKQIPSDKKWLLVSAVSIFFVSLWYIKNLIMTGNPVFPVLAGAFKTFGFTHEQGEAIQKWTSGVSPALLIKYMAYFFIWPGINAAKIVIITVCFLPLFLFFQKNKEQGRMEELYFWLCLSILAVAGTALACHWEPRYYRFPIGVMAFTAIASIQFMASSLGVKNRYVIGALMLFVAFR